MIEAVDARPLCGQRCVLPHYPRGRLFLALTTTIACPTRCCTWGRPSCTRPWTVARIRSSEPRLKQRARRQKFKLITGKTAIKISGTRWYGMFHAVALSVEPILNDGTLLEVATWLLEHEHCVKTAAKFVELLSDARKSVFSR